MIKNIPNAIIDLPRGLEPVEMEKADLEITIKNQGKVIYHNACFAVVMNMVQSVTKIETEKDFEIDGDSQVVALGHPLVTWFAYDQLGQKLRKTGIYNMVLQYLQQNVKNTKLRDKVIEIFKRHKIEVKI